MSGNQTTGIVVEPLVDFRAFDTLPARARRVLAAAPYDYAATPYAKAWRRRCQRGGIDIGDFVRELVADICADIMIEARDTYGPDHPDAIASRLREASRQETGSRLERAA